MAYPPEKYSGLYSRPSRDTRQPAIRRCTRKRPLGVRAISQTPSTQYLRPLPVETGIVRTTRPSRTSINCCRLISISTNKTLLAVGFAVVVGNGGGVDVVLAAGTVVPGGAIVEALESGAMTISAVAVGCNVVVATCVVVEVPSVLGGCGVDGMSGVPCP